MTTCYVPVIGYTPGIQPNWQLGYELWVNNKHRSVPYIFKTTLEEYGQQIDSILGGIRGMTYDTYLHVPPRALYCTHNQALYALQLFIPMRTIVSLNK